MNPIFSYTYLFPAIALPTLLVLAYTYKAFNLRPENVFHITSTDILAGLFFLYVTLNIYLKSFTAPKISDYYTVIICALLYVILRVYYQNKLLVSRVITFLTLIGFSEAVIAGTQLMQGQILLGSFGNRAVFANVLAAIFPFMAYSLVVARQNKRPLYEVGFFAASSGLTYYLIAFHSYSRTAFIATSLVGLLLVLQATGVFSTKLSKRKLTILISSLVVGFTLLVAGALFIKADSTSGRWFILQREFELILHQPFFGIGFKNFDKCYNDHQSTYFANHTNPDAELLSAYVNVNYNEYMDLLLKGGLFGGLLFILLLANLTKRIRSNRKSSLMFILSLAGLFVLGLFSYPGETMIIVFIFLFSVTGMISAEKTHSFVFRANEKVVFIALSIVSLVVSGGLIYRYNAVMRWHLIASSKPAQALNAEAIKRLYTSVMPELSDDPLVLKDFARNLYLTKDYPGAISLLNQATAYSSHYDLYVLLGECYEKLNSLSEAESAYLKSSLLVPKLFYPRYRLMMLYTNQQDDAQALKLANKIIEMPIKIDSKLVREIKARAWALKTQLPKEK
ncbi:hypothetical protein BWI93_13185 [Siphonobacter sp. BAB-5385]|uniref:O-antigen ligase family protein n=1 Tax=Siphonobacter sp. BAB-5385 TaxID=1864822 RepID=UPI000B9E2AE2|nr:O-antigen ligase family protein [Siphonobacter sp. BAB-5385]OZI07713.1 hypothetical protein BWI93_13185 [Siphonobacter sp. BAB-5385]